MKLKIGNDCIVCSFCSRACPVGAPFFDGDKMAINNDKCVGCGKCISACRLGAIYDSDKPAPAPIPHERKYEKCDILVIGGGAAGLVAAVRAAELSGKKVIILEKGKKTGGCAPYASGMRILDSKWELDAGIEPLADKYVVAAMNTTRWELNPKLVYNTFHGIPRFFDWVCEWAHPEDTFRLGVNPMGDIGVDIISNAYGAGQFITDRFTQRCGELGIDIKYQCPAKDLIRDENGRVTGVIAEDTGGEIEISCSECLISAGSLVNSEILTRVIPEYKGVFTRRYGHRHPNMTGDGVEMAERAGIKIDYDSICIAHLGPLCLPVDMQSIHAGKPFNTELLKHVNRPETLKVNLNGERWINESYNADICWQMLKQPQCTSYTILDHKLITGEIMPPAVTLADFSKGRMISSAIPREGKEPDIRTIVGRGTAGVFGNAVSDYNELIKWSELPGRHLVVANTPEELAQKLDIPVDVFTETLQRYNKMCEEGYDSDFYKDSKYLIPINQGPYYAINAYLPTDGAFGGLDINENMQVMSGSTPVDGLYAAGDNTGSRYICPGRDKIEIINDLTWAVTSGFLAGENMAKALNS